MNLSFKIATATMFATSAWASLIPSLTSVTPVSANNFQYTYTANLSSDERLDPAATNGNTCPSPGTTVQCNPAGTFLTIYDFAGFTGVTTVPSANWTLTTQNVGITPSSINGASFDNPALLNLTFSYSGPVVQGPNSFVFTANSTFGTTSTTGNFTSQLTKSDLTVGNSSGNGLTDQILGPLTVPTQPSKVPEPASLFMMGSGLLGLGYLVRRRKA